MVSDDGYILSAYHVLHPSGTTESVQLVDVEFTGDRHVTARVVGLEPTINLAVLKVDAPFAVTPIGIGDIDTVRVGSWAIAVGDPEGAERTFSVGTVAARPERDCYQEQLSRTYLQSSVRIHPESFGGPLLNLQGQVIGINTPRFDSDVENRDLTGAGSVYALPINLAMTVYEALKVEESKRSPWLGISVLDLTADVRERYEKTPRTGVLIDNVFDPSPASRAGLQVGDFLTHMDTQQILAVPDFQRWLYLYGIGEEMMLKIFRDGEVLEVDVTIEERPESAVTN